MRARLGRLRASTRLLRPRSVLVGLAALVLCAGLFTVTARPASAAWPPCTQPPSGSQCVPVFPSGGVSFAATLGGPGSVAMSPTLCPPNVAANGGYCSSPVTFSLAIANDGPGVYNIHFGEHESETSPSTLYGIGDVTPVPGNASAWCNINYNIDPNSPYPYGCTTGDATSVPVYLVAYHPVPNDTMLMCAYGQYPSGDSFGGCMQIGVTATAGPPPPPPPPTGDTLTASVTSGAPTNGLLPVTLTLTNSSTGTVSGLTYPSVPGLVVVPDPVATGGSMTMVDGPNPALPTSIPPQTTVTVTYDYSVDVPGAIELGTEVHGTDSVSGAQDAPAAGVFTIAENPSYGQTGAAVGDNLTNGLSQVAAQGGQVYRTSIDWIGANHASLPGATPGQTQPTPYQLEMAATMGLPPSAAWVIPNDPLQAQTVLQGLRAGIEQGHIDAGTSIGQGVYNLGQAVLAGPTGWKAIAQGVGQSIATGTAALNGAITAGLTPFANFAYASTADKGAMLAAFPNAVPSQVTAVSTALQGQLAALSTQYANDPAGFAYAWARATTANVDKTVAAGALTAVGQEGVVAAAGPTVTKAVAAVNAFGEPYMATLSSSAGQFASALTSVPTAIAGTAAPLDGAVADAVNQGAASYAGAAGVTPTAGWQSRVAAVTTDAAAGFTDAQIAELQAGGITVYEAKAIQQVAAQEQAIMKARGYDVTYGIGIAEATPESEAVYQQALIDHAKDPSIPLPRAKGEAFKDMKSLMADDLELGAPRQYMGLGAVYKPTMPAQSVLDTLEAANPGSADRIVKRYNQMLGAYNAAFDDTTYLGKNISLATQPGGNSFTFPGTFPRSETWDLRMSVANGLDGKPLLDPTTGRPLAFTLVDKTNGAPMIADLDISATFNVATGQQLPVGEKAASFLRVRQGLQKLGVRTADHGWYGFDLSTQDLVGTKAMFRSRLERTNPANVPGYSQQLANAYNKLAAAAGKPSITAGDLLVGAKLARLTVTFTAKTVSKGFIA